MELILSLSNNIRKQKILWAKSNIISIIRIAIISIDILRKASQKTNINFDNLYIDDYS